MRSHRPDFRKKEKTMKHEVAPRKRNSTITAVQAANRYRDGTYWADPRYQRPTCWSIEQERRYLKNLVAGMTVGGVVNCCLHTALVLEEQYGGCAEIQEELKKHLRANHQESILDSQNRLNTLDRFFQDKITIKGSFVLQHHPEPIVLSKFTKYNDLPQKLKTAFEFAAIEVTTYETSYSGEFGASSIFRGLNSGEPLTHQQKRRTNSTPISPYIIALSKQKTEPGGKAPNFLGYTGEGRGKKMTSIKTKGSANEEFILDLMMITHPLLGDKRGNFPSGQISHETRDKFYTIGNKETPEEYCDDYKQRFEKILSILDRLVVERYKQGANKQVPKTELYQLLYFSEYMVDQLGANYTTEDCIEMLDNDWVVSKVFSSYRKEVKKDLADYQAELERFEAGGLATEPKLSARLQNRQTVPFNPENRKYVKEKMYKTFEETVNELLSNYESYDEEQDLEVEE